MITVIDRWLEPAVALSGATGIKPYAAYSLLSCKRWPLVGGILEQSPCGWPWPKEGWGKKQTEEEPSCVSCSLCCCRSHQHYHPLTFQKTFSVSERSEQQVRFLCAGGSGVWTSCRLDPILRLFDWFTGRLLQEVDFSALATKTLGANTVCFPLRKYAI